MHNDEQIKDNIYSLLMGSGLVSEVSGVLSKTLRPRDSDAEDIVISVLDNRNSQLQAADVNVNIYVPDLLVDGQYEEDTARLRELAARVATLLDSRSPSDYLLKLDRQRVLKVDGKDEHYINTRLKYTFLNVN